MMYLEMCLSLYWFKWDEGFIELMIYVGRILYDGNIVSNAGLLVSLPQVNRCLVAHKAHGEPHGEDYGKAHGKAHGKVG
jgi:hypothetical protein